MAAQNISNSKTQTADTQAGINPAMAVQMLKDGNARFTSGDPLNRDLHQQVKETASGQYSFAAIF